MAEWGRCVLLVVLQPLLFQVRPQLLPGIRWALPALARELPPISASLPTAGAGLELPGPFPQGWEGLGGDGENRHVEAVGAGRSWALLEHGGAGSRQVLGAPGTWRHSEPAGFGPSWNMEALGASPSGERIWSQGTGVREGWIRCPQHRCAPMGDGMG